MKKILITLTALAALVACNKAEVIETNRQAIGFGTPFVDYATKAAIDGTYSGNKELTTFYVWGSVTGNGNTTNVFNSAKCTGSVGMTVWGCDQTEYWLPSCEYQFTAIVDADPNGVATGNYYMPTSITVTSNGQKDLLLATATATTNANAEPSQNPVSFTFSHLMSKAHFTFKNEVGSSKYAFQITNINVTNLYQTGVYTIGATTPWSVSNISTATIDFGNAVYEDGAGSIATGKTATSNYARTFLPATYGESNKFMVSFDATIVYNGTAISKKSYEIEASHTFAPNSAYNFLISLGAGDEITFTVDKLKGWGETPDIAIP